MFLLSVDELDVDNINGKPEIRTVNKQVADCHVLTACIAVRFFLLIYSLFSVFNCEILLLLSDAYWTWSPGPSIEFE